MQIDIPARPDIARYLIMVESLLWNLVLGRDPSHQQPPATKHSKF